MNDTLVIYLLVAGGIVVFYVLLLNRLNKFIQPMRLSMAREGELLLAERTLPEPYRRNIEVMLSNAYNPVLAPVFAVALPVFLLLVALRVIKTDVPTIHDASLRARYRNFDIMSTISTLAANPIFGVVVLAEGLVVVALLALLGGSWQLVVKAKRVLLDVEVAGRLIHGH